jgi:homoserine kinase type II
MSPLDLLPEWGLPAPDSVRPAGRGTNNVMLVVEIGASSYVLRGVQNFALEQVLAEHALLRAVSAAGLPFAVPSPLPTPDGRTVVADGEELAALFPYVPGRHPEWNVPADVAAAAGGLAELDLALASLPLSLAPTDWRRPFSAIHPAVTDVDELAAELTRALPSSEGLAWFVEHAHATDERHRVLQETLPTQIVHGDFALSNVLLADDGSVAAILDFEIAGIDLRVVDPVAGLMSMIAWAEADDGPVEAFARGYAKRWPLSAPEAEALPVELRHRALGSMIWRAGRWRRGQATLDEVRERLDYGVFLESRAAAVLPESWS